MTDLAKAKADLVAAQAAEQAALVAFHATGTAKAELALGTACDATKRAQRYVDRAQLLADQEQERQRQAARAKLRTQMAEEHEACANHYSAAAELSRDRAAALLESIDRELQALKALADASASRSLVERLAAGLGEAPPPAVVRKSASGIVADYLVQAMSSSSGARHSAIHALVSAVDPGYWRVHGLQRSAERAAELARQAYLRPPAWRPQQVVPESPLEYVGHSSTGRPFEQTAAPAQVADLRALTPPAATKYGSTAQREDYYRRSAEARASMTTPFAVALESSVTLADGTRRSSLQPVEEHEMHPSQFRQALRMGTLMERLTVEEQRVAG